MFNLKHNILKLKNLLSDFYNMKSLLQWKENMAHFSAKFKLKIVKIAKIRGKKQMSQPFLVTSTFYAKVHFQNLI